MANSLWLSAKQRAVGEDALHPASIAQEAVQTGFSPHHMVGNWQRIFRDSYVVAGVYTSGVLAGTDYTIEVRGHLTEVKPLSAPGIMDYERWIQSVDASAHTKSYSHGHSYGGAVAGNYSDPKRRFVPAGRYLHRRTVTEGDTVNDNSAAFRVTTENDVAAHRFSAKATYVITVRMGRRNVVAAMLSSEPTRTEERIVELPDAVEFLLNDNDLINHPEFRLHGAPEPSDPGPYDRLLPPRVVESNELGYAAVVEAEPEADLQALMKDKVNEISPGVMDPGSSVYLREVEPAINEHSTSLGLLTLPNAGPEGHTAFHFVHRSAYGPNLVEVSLNARPIDDLSAARGRFALKTAGLDTVLGHTNGDGSTLPVPGTTRHSRVNVVSNQIEFSPMAQINGYRFKPTFAMNRQSDDTEEAVSMRERRIWERSVGDTSEFNLGYEYTVAVKSVFLDDALVVRVPRLMAELLGRVSRGIGTTKLAANAYGLVPDRWKEKMLELFERLPHPAQLTTGSVRVAVRARFNGSETPRETGVTVQSPVHRIEPAVFTGDPTEALMPSPDGAVVIDMEMGASTRELLSGDPWLPTRSFAVYEFDAVLQLVEALREVDPDLADHPQLRTRTSTSSEGQFLRLAQLAATGRLALLSPAATAPYLGRPGSGSTALQIRILAPHSGSDSRDTAIDRIKIDSDGASTKADLTLTPSVTLTVSPSLNSMRQDRIAAAGPFGGAGSTMGQWHARMVPRREMLRFGTPMAGAAEGVRGHEVSAAGMVTVVGPRGTRWVSGNIILRTTEAPPGFEAQRPADATQHETPVPDPVPVSESERDAAAEERMEQVPVVRRGVAERKWTARNVSAEDLPDDLSEHLPGLDVGGGVSTAELSAAGIVLPLGLEVEVQLSGLRPLSPLDQVRVLMVRPGPWPSPLDTIEAATSRRIWALAAAEIEGGGEVSADATTGTDPALT